MHTTAGSGELRNVILNRRACCEVIATSFLPGHSFPIFLCGPAGEVRGNPTLYYRRAGSGSSYGAGVRVGAVRCEAIRDNNSGNWHAYLAYGAWSGKGVDFGGLGLLSSLRIRCKLTKCLCYVLQGSGSELVQPCLQGSGSLGWSTVACAEYRNAVPCALNAFRQCLSRNAFRQCLSRFTWQTSGLFNEGRVCVVAPW